MEMIKSVDPRTGEEVVLVPLTASEISRIYRLLGRTTVGGDHINAVVYIMQKLRYAGSSITSYSED